MFWITIDQILCFQAVIEEGSFNQASEKLGKAKSAIRYTVNNLEQQLGFPLLDRRAYRPKMTQQGEAFLFRSQKLLASYSELQHYCAQIAAKIEMRLRISVSDIIEMQPLYNVIKNAMQKFPNTEIILEREILSGERMLAKEQVDLALFESLHNKKDVDHKKLGSINLLMVIAGDHPFLQQPISQQNKTRLFRYPQIVQRSTLADEHQVGVHQEALRWRVTDTASKKEVIANGLGWGRLPEHLIRKELDSGALYHLKHLADDDQVDIVLCKRKHANTGQVAQFIWDSF